MYKNWKINRDHEYDLSLKQLHKQFLGEPHPVRERIEERGRMETRIIGRSLFTIYSYLITHLGYLEAILKQGFALSRLESVWVTLRPLVPFIINKLCWIVNPWLFID